MCHPVSCPLSAGQALPGQGRSENPPEPRASLRRPPSCRSRPSSPQTLLKPGASGWLPTLHGASASLELVTSPPPSACARDPLCRRGGRRHRLAPSPLPGRKAEQGAWLLVLVCFPGKPVPGAKLIPPFPNERHRRQLPVCTSSTSEIIGLARPSLGAGTGAHAHRRPCPESRPAVSVWFIYFFQERDFSPKLFHRSEMQWPRLLTSQMAARSGAGASPHGRAAIYLPLQRGALPAPPTPPPAVPQQWRRPWVRAQLVPPSLDGAGKRLLGTWQLRSWHAWLCLLTALFLLDFIKTPSAVSSDKGAERKGGAGGRAAGGGGRAGRRCGASERPGPSWRGRALVSFPPAPSLARAPHGATEAGRVLGAGMGALGRQWAGAGSQKPWYKLKPKRGRAKLPGEPRSESGAQLMCGVKAGLETICQ